MTRFAIQFQEPVHIKYPAFRCVAFRVCEEISKNQQSLCFQVFGIVETNHVDAFSAAVELTREIKNMVPGAKFYAMTPESKLYEGEELTPIEAAMNFAGM